jgi:hypothetical protein
MRVCVYYRRHDGLPAQIHATGARRDLNLAASANLRETDAIDDKYCILDWRAAVANQQSSAFESSHALTLNRQQRHCERKQGEKQACNKQFHWAPSFCDCRDSTTSNQPS